MASLALAFDILARDKASREFDKVGDAIDRAGRKGDGFGKTLGKGLKIAGGALLGLGAAAIAGFGPMIKEARESAKIGRLTEAVVKSTGGAAKISADQVGALAEAISNKTAVDDEAIQSGANLMLTFTKVRNEAGKGNDIFNQSVEAANNMSVALGTDMKSASLQLGKALNDPIKGVTALGRAGVSFTQQQKDQIKTLVESGDTLGAQKIILGEMQKQFGGAAQAAADPLDRLKVVAGNLGEKVGGVLLPYVERFANFVSDKVVPAVVKFIDEFENGEGAGGQFRDMIAEVVDKVKDAGKWISENADTVKVLVTAVASAVAIFKTITTAINVWKVAQAALNIVLSANPIGIVVIAIAALVAGLVIAYQKSETFRTIVDKAFSVVKIAALTLAKVAVTAFQLLANVWMTVVGVIIDGAANAFGWIPGLGPKLRGAQTKFHEFKDGANAAMEKIKNDIQVNIDTEKAKGQVDALWRAVMNKNWTVQVQARFNGLSAASAKAQALVGLEGRRALGGPVKAGAPYLVGEKGPEIIVPKVSGTVLTASETRAAMAAGGGGVGGYARLHPHDIAAIVKGFADARPTAVMDTASANRALAVGW